MNKSYWKYWLQEYSDIRNILHLQGVVYDEDFSDNLTLNSSLWLELYSYYQEIMPYEYQKARDNDPYIWVEERLEKLFS